MANQLTATIQTGDFLVDAKSIKKRTLIYLYPKNGYSNFPCVSFFLDELNIRIHAGAEVDAPILKNDVEFFKDALDFISELKPVLST